MVDLNPFHYHTDQVAPLLPIYFYDTLPYPSCKVLQLPNNE